MQEKMRKLVEESSKKKKEKKKRKEKDKTKRVVTNSSSLGKPGGAHGAPSKSNSAVTDSVDDSIASVVSGADVKVGVDMHHHPPGGKSINMHHPMAAGANAAAKPPKSKSKFCFSLFIFLFSISLSLITLFIFLKLVRVPLKKQVCYFHFFLQFYRGFIIKKKTIKWSSL